MIYPNKSQQDALFLNFISVKNSTRFGQTYRPSSGVTVLYSQPTDIFHTSYVRETEHFCKINVI